MGKETMDYHYKLLELYRFEELKILIDRLCKEAIAELEKDKYPESLGKYHENVKLLDDYTK